MCQTHLLTFIFVYSQGIALKSNLLPVSSGRTCTVYECSYCMYISEISVMEKEIIFMNYLAGMKTQRQICLCTICCKRVQQLVREKDPEEIIKPLFIPHKLQRSKHRHVEQIKWII